VPRYARAKHDRYTVACTISPGTPTAGRTSTACIRAGRAGVTILDAPAEYPQYGTGYYAVFFADPDGLKLEYVHYTGT
jgi:catechol 2,3-dioxygenase-like lactoylglutathione lyase family enzyme